MMGSPHGGGLLLTRDRFVALVVLLVALIAPPARSQEPVTPTPAPQVAPRPILRPGDPIDAEIGADSPVIHTPVLDKDYADAPVRGVAFQAELPAGTTTIELVSYFFDAYLVVRGEHGEILAEDDDGLVRTHSRVVLELEAPRTIDVVACALHRRVGRCEFAARSGRPEALTPIERGAADLADTRREVEVRSEVCGPASVDTALSLNNLGLLLDDQGKYDEARTHFERALRICEETLGPQRLETAICLNNIAGSLEKEGRYAEARQLCERSLEIHEKTLGPENAGTAMVLNNLAGLFLAEYRYADARPLYERALRIREKVLGPDHPDTAVSINNLAALLYHEGKYSELRPLYERALQIRQKALGPKHPMVAAALDNLAATFEFEGRYAEARPLYERGLEIREAALGRDHPDVATSLNQLARLLESTGRRAEAHPLYERALRIREKALGPDHWQTATSLNNLALLLKSERKYAEARPLLERALAITEKVFGPEHPETATHLNNLAKLLCAEGEYEPARPLLKRALAIKDNVLGSEDPATAVGLESLAELSSLLGQYAEARPLRERALAIKEKVLGRDHPSTRASRGTLALLSLDEGARAEARRLAEQWLSGCFADSLQQSRNAAQADVVRVVEQCEAALALRVTLARLEGGEPAVASCYADVVRFKGWSAREASSRRDALRESLDAATRTKLDELRSVRSSFSNLLSAREVKSRERHERDLEALRKRRIALEADLSEAIADRPELEPVAPAQLRAALPEGAVLLDFLELRPYEPAVLKDVAVVEKGRWGASRVYVWITRADREQPTFVDLGPSAPIEAAVAAALETVRTAGRGVGGAVQASRSPATAPPAATESALVELRRLLWDPIARHVDDAASGDGRVAQLIVSADGALGLLPFGIVLDEKGRHLLERFKISAVDDASLLLRRDAPRPSQPPTLLIAGAIDYDAGGAWSRLAATQDEAGGIARAHRARFQDAPRLELREREPTEERLKLELPRYSVLHLATHGYFLADGLRSLVEATADRDERDRFETAERQLAASYWPSLLCGVVCAGANRPQPGRDNGLLTGEEVSSLDLAQCDLVVLSACESGRGRLAAAGQGVLSLSRAFREAGARTVIGSLWQVRDDSTRDLMLDFYDRLWNRGESKLDALRDAQLAMLRRNREKHGDSRPATWGAFVLTGATE